MSKAFKCDRCGKLFEYGGDHPVKQPILVYNLEHACDFCETCDREIKNWFANVKEEKDENES